MTRAYFEETQTFREHGWVWAAVITVCLFTLLPLASGLYSQLAMGEPWGDKPLTNEGLIVMLLSVTVSLAIPAFIVLSAKLETKIDETGIHYRFYPLKRKWQTVRPDSIVSYSLEKKFKLFDSALTGYKRNRFKQLRSFKITGGKHLALKLRNDRTLLLGTQNPENVEWAIKKMVSKHK